METIDAHKQIRVYPPMALLVGTTKSSDVNDSGKRWCFSPFRKRRGFQQGEKLLWEEISWKFMSETLVHFPIKKREARFLGNFLSKRKISRRLCRSGFIQGRHDSPPQKSDCGVSVTTQKSYCFFTSLLSARLFLTSPLLFQA